MRDAMESRAEKRARRDAYLVEHANATKALKTGELEEILGLLGSEWRATRKRVVQELRKRGWTGRALPQLIEHAAREEDDSVQLSIALALRDLEDSRAVGTLWALFESGSDAVQMAALQGLSLLGDERVIPIAVSWYQSRDAGLEAKAKRSIGIFDLLLLQSTNGDRAVADLLAAETSWRQRLLIRRTARRARRWLASHT